MFLRSEAPCDVTASGAQWLRRYGLTTTFDLRGTDEIAWRPSALKDAFRYRPISLTGGAETFLMKLYRNLDREKYQMDFCINVKEKSFYEDEILSLGGRIFRIPPKSQNLKEFKKQLYELIKKERYEYVLRVCSNAIGFMELKIAKSAGAKVCAVRSSNSSDGGSLKVKLLHMLGKVLYNKYIDVRIAPSDLAAKHTFGERAYKNGKVNTLPSM